MYSIIKELALPPGSIWLLLTAGLLLLLFKKRIVGLRLLGAALILFYLLSTSVVASRLSALVQTTAPLTEDAARGASAHAIVVLSGGLHYNAPELGGVTVDEITLERLRYAARLHRSTALPILVSGGRPVGSQVTLAGAMRDSLLADFGVTGVMMEEKSLNTQENAQYSAAMLRARGIYSILLVTHASHMPRAARAFADSGLEVIPAPTIYAHTSLSSPRSYIPTLSGLAESHYAIYEITGRVWYELRY